ncbi:MAG: hypothetical protein MJ146_03280 [Clostridia bacterium]|nr:hypothetical protein [Clostridia bacterium]
MGYLCVVLMVMGIGVIFFKPRFTFKKRIGKIEKVKPKKRLRLRSTYNLEAQGVITELINSYKLYNHNMDEAINHAVSNMGDSPGCQKLFLNLSASLNQGKGEEGIKTLEEKIGASWGQNLGEIIYSGHIMGLDVEKALLDLLDRVKRGKVMEEYSKRKNNEARIMIKWFTPLAYVATTLIAVKFFGISLSDFLHNQFQTAAGILWLFIMGIFYAMSLVTYYLLAKRGIDI